MSKAINDFDAITQTVERYVDGASRGDVGAIKEALHPDFRMFGTAGGQRVDIGLGSFLEISAAWALNNGGTYTSRIASVQQFGDAAVAVLLEDGCWGEVSFVDLLSLSRVGGDWKIVCKTFTHVSGKMPG
jgi:hypothetical protein